MSVLCLSLLSEQRLGVDELEGLFLQSPLMREVLFFVFSAVFECHFAVFALARRGHSPLFSLILKLIPTVSKAAAKHYSPCFCLSFPTTCGSAIR